MTHCRCGGTLELDRGYLADAERFGLRDEVPLMWKCMMCGRSQRSDTRVPLGMATPPPPARSTPRLVP